jgi:hypothetical protein
VILTIEKKRRKGERRRGKSRERRGEPGQGQEPLKMKRIKRKKQG